MTTASASGLPSQIGAAASRILAPLESWVSHATAPYIAKAISVLIPLLLVAAALIVLRLAVRLRRR